MSLLDAAELLANRFTKWSFKEDIDMIVYGFTEVEAVKAFREYLSCFACFLFTVLDTLF